MSDRRVDQLTTVNPSLTDLIMLIQNGEAVNTTFARIRNLIVGSGSLETAATDIIAALNEINTKESNSATNITNLKNKIGTGDFSTTSQNAVGAVAELKEGVDNLTESVAKNAEDIASNTASLNANTQNIENINNNFNYEDNFIIINEHNVQVRNEAGNLIPFYTSGINFANGVDIGGNSVFSINAHDLQLRLMTNNINGVTVVNADGNGYSKISASAFNVSSKEEFKTNIEEVNADLELLKKSKIYEYNLKDELEKGIYEKHYGFVIGRETPEEILSPSKDTIDIYSLVSLLWRQNQELLDRISILEDITLDLLNGDGENE